MGSKERSRAGYLGPAGTFTEEALLASAIPDAVEPVALGTIYEVVMAVGRGDVEWAIAPIENSLDGSVSVTLDLLADEQIEVQIVGEVRLSVRHSLIASEAVELSEIETVLTHPQVPGQCTLFLRGELAQARIVTSASTAEAVRIVTSEARRERAALGTLLAAEIYGGTVIRAGVQDRDDNETRFVWLARAGQRAAAPLALGEGSEWKTSIVFWGPGAESPGWLVRCLDEFARRDINLTKIESRPRRERLGRYMFFADLGGRLSDARVGEAVEGVRQLCEQVRVLGSYRAASASTAAKGAGG